MNSTPSPYSHLYWKKPTQYFLLPLMKPRCPWVVGTWSRVTLRTLVNLRPKEKQVIQIHAYPQVSLSHMLESRPPPPPKLSLTASHPGFWQLEPVQIRLLSSPGQRKQSGTFLFAPPYCRLHEIPVFEIWPIKGPPTCSRFLVQFLLFQCHSQGLRYNKWQQFWRHLCPIGYKQAFRSDPFIRITQHPYPHCQNQVSLVKVYQGQRNQGTTLVAIFTSVDIQIHSPGEGSGLPLQLVASTLPTFLCRTTSLPLFDVNLMLLAYNILCNLLPS